jgi:hypothetical protein
MRRPVVVPIALDAPLPAFPGAPGRDFSGQPRTLSLCRAGGKDYKGGRSGSQRNSVDTRWVEEQRVHDEAPFHRFSHRLARANSPAKFK